MKIKVTYDETDIKRLIRADLVRQGIPAADADIDLKKSTVATVTMEVSGDMPAEPAAPTPVPVEPARDITKPNKPPPALEVVDGGASAADMSDVFAQSQSIARSRAAPFPSPPPHKLLDGESFEYPGDKS